MDWNQGWSAGEHLVQDAGQAVDIAPPIQGERCRRLLGTHVIDGADRDSRLGELLCVGALYRAGNAEVGEQCVPVRQEDVAGLHVAVNEAERVRVGESVGLIAEQLRFPAFTEEEFNKAKAQFAGSLQRSAENTDFRAEEAFKQAVYSPGHPNREATTDEYLAALQTVKLDEVKAFHAKYFGPAHCTFVLVGDVDGDVIKSQFASAFAGWTGGVDYVHPAKSTGTDAPKEQTVFMADKTSVSVTIGQASGLHYGDPGYVALRTATSILGSDFTSRLVAQVRDTEGLTYGIRAQLAHDDFSDGDWKITATFAPKLLNQGITSTMKQLKAWYDQGVTDNELAKRKTNLIGATRSRSRRPTAWPAR